MGRGRESIRPRSQHSRVRAPLYLQILGWPLKLCSIHSNFSVGYGIGGVQGTAYRDTVVIGQAIGAGQIIGAATTIDRFDLVKPIDGIRTSL